MRRFKSLHLAMLTLGSLCLNSAYASDTLHSLSDSEMSATTGQALMSMSYISPQDDANLEANRTNQRDPNNGGIGFYKLGMEAEVELNANIKKLQLGCGGMNGAGVCDIDIDNLSLSGVVDRNDRNARASSSAKITNPFLEFAIKNPSSASTREVVGFRLSAEKVQGLLTTGLENSAQASGINVLSGYMKIASDSSADVIKGKLDTKPGYLDAGWFWNHRTVDDQNGSLRNLAECGGQPCKYSDGTNIEPLKGSLSAPLAASANFQVNGGGFWIPGVTDIAFSAPLSSLRSMRADGTYIDGTGKINGNRIVGVEVTPNTVNLPNAVLGFNPGPNRLNNDQKCDTPSCNVYGETSGFVSPSVYPHDANNNFTGNRQTNPLAFQASTVSNLKTQGGLVTSVAYNCTALGFIPCSLVGINNWSTQFDVKMFGKITGLKADVTFQEKLGFIHSLEINSAASLSLQRQALLWPGQNSDDIAQPGWWLSMSDPVYVGDLLPTNPVDLCPGGPYNVARCAYPQFIKQANALNLNAQTDDLNAMLSRTNPLAVKLGTIGLNGFNLILSDLQLATQNFAPNCYGNLKFC